MKLGKIMWLAPLMMLVGAFWSCENSETGNPEFTLPNDGPGNNTAKELVIQPEKASVDKGGKMQFSARLKGIASGTVTWSFSGDKSGDTKISDDGLLEVASDEQAETLTVTANVTAKGKTLSASVPVTVLGSGGSPEEHGVTVTPGIVIVGKGVAQTFSAMLSATGKAASGVTWTVEGGADNASVINGSGVLSVSNGETAERLVVKAALGGGKYGTAIVYIDGNREKLPAGAPFPKNLGIAVDPLTVTLNKGDTRDFTATPDEGGIKWSLDGRYASGISENGVLTVAADEKAEKIAVKASASDNPSRYGVAVVTVRGNEKYPGPVSAGLTVEPLYVDVARGGEKKFTAKDRDGVELNSGLSWRTLGGGASGTTIDNSGNLSVAAEESAAYLTVRAESGDGSSGTAVVTLTGSGKVTGGDNKDTKKAAFTALGANGEAGKTTTTELTLTFDKDIAGLGAGDIKISADSTNPAKASVNGVVTRIETGVYRLPITVSEAGIISVTVSRSGYSISGSPKTVTVHWSPAVAAVDFTGLSANGADGAQATTELTLNFDKDIENLNTIDVTLNAGSTGAVKGALKKTASRTGAYMLGISGVSATGEVSVSVSKSGYSISGSPKKVTVYRGPVTAAFTGLSANGVANTTTTTELTLNFDKDIENLSAVDVTLNAGSTEAVKGALKKTGGSTGVYTLEVGGISAAGEVSVTVSKSGYSISGSPRKVNVHRGPVAAVLKNLSADGAANTTTTRLTFQFDRDISGLSQADITVSSGSTGAVKGVLTKAAGTGLYTLGISGIASPGSISATVSKSGYSISGAPKTVNVYKRPPKSLKETFGIGSTGTGAVTAAFNEAHNFVSSGGLVSASGKIELGDYIDLEGGLSVAAYGSGNHTGGFTIRPGAGKDQALQTFTVASNAKYNPGYRGALLRLIVVGINSFHSNGTYVAPPENNDKQHLVFQFQNIPVSRRMNPAATSSGGYKGSEMRAYLTGNFLTGLKNAGVPESVLWAPKRYVAQGPSGSACDTIEDKLWLTTEREIFGFDNSTYAFEGYTYGPYSNASAEKAKNQARLQYYTSTNSRIKYTHDGVNSDGSSNFGYYWNASPWNGDTSSFCVVYIYGYANRYNPADATGCAPAFCVY
jgi:hypothetical protein